MNIDEKNILTWSSSRLGQCQSSLVVKTAYSEVWRLRAEDRVYYAKKTTGTLRSEPLMYQLITKVMGAGWCPEVIDVARDSGFFLTLDLGGLTLREKFDRDGFNITLVCQAYETMLELQQAMSSSVVQCIDCGSSDWRADRLGLEFIAMLDSHEFCKMHGLSSQDIDAARCGVEILKHCTAELAGMIPGEYWSDDDLNDKNIIMSGSCYGFVDMGETSIGLPLVGVYTSLSSLRQKRLLADDSPADIFLRDVCLGASGVKASDRARAWSLCKTASFIYRAVCLNRLIMNSEPNLLLDPRYKWRMHDILSQISRLS